MNRFVLALIITGNLLLLGFAQQQSNPVEITRMQVNIWPEYDKQNVLVIDRFQLSENTKLPVQISLRIPREVGAPYKVAMIDLDGQLYNLEYTLIPEGVWNRVVFTTSSAELQIEYYDPRLVIDENERSFSFSWIGDYPVESLQVSVQQPRLSYNLSIIPDLGPGQLNLDDRLVYYTTSIGKVEAGITFSLEIGYTKIGNTLSAANLPVIAATAIPKNGGGGQVILDVIQPVFENSSLLIAGGLVVGAMLLFVLVSLIAGDKILDIKQFFRKRASDEKRKKEVEDPEVYCSQCGKRIKPGDRYCRVCGSLI